MNSLPARKFFALPLLVALPGLMSPAGLPAQPAAPLTAVAIPTQTPPADMTIVELSPFTVTAEQDRGYQAQSSLAGSRLRSNLKDVASPTSAFTEKFFLDTAITDTQALAAFMVSTEYDYAEDAGNQNNQTGVTRPLRMRGIQGGDVTTNFFKAGGRSDMFSTERIDQSRGPNSVLFGIGSPGGIINVTTKRARFDRSAGSVALQVRSEGGDREEADYNQVVVKDRLGLRVAAVNTRFNSWRNYEFNDENRSFGTARWQIAPRTELNVEGERGAVTKQTKRTYTAFDGYTAWAGAGRILSATPNAAQGTSRLSTAPYLIFDTNSGTLMNWRNALQSLRRTSADGDPLGITDFGLLPKETSIYGPGYDQKTDYSRLSAYLNHSFTRDWNVELAALRYSNHTNNTDPQVVASQYLNADPNPNLPNGQPNPNAGRAYLESFPQFNFNDTRDDFVRAIMSYRLDLGRWGSHLLAGVAQRDFTRMDRQALREFVVSPNAPGPAAPENNNNRIFRRTYVDLNGPSSGIVMADPHFPVSGQREIISGNVYQTALLPFSENTQRNHNDGSSTIGMLQSSFWQKRLNTVVGASQDQRTDYISTVGRTPLAGFTQGVFTPIVSHTGVKTKATNFSFSGVFHVRPWLGLTFSRAENSALPSFSGFLHTANGRPPIPRGQSQDFGLKLDLFDNRLFVTATYFQTSARDDFGFGQNVGAASINPIWNALEAAGVLAANRLTLDQVTDRTTGATYDSESEGVELEFTANPTPNWRVFGNYAYGRTQAANIGREMIAYVAEQRGFWTQGTNGRVLLDGSGALATFERDNDGVIETVAERLDAIDQEIFTKYVLSDGRRPLGQIPHKLNVRTAYDFTQGKLRGVTVGSGVRYLSKPVIGYTATGTSAAITRTTVYGPEQVFVDLQASYSRKFKALGRNTTWVLQLNVNNALNNDSYQRTRLSSAGEVQFYRFNPPREWILTNRFLF